MPQIIFAVVERKKKFWRCNFLDIVRNGHSSAPLSNWKMCKKNPFKTCWKNFSVPADDAIFTALKTENNSDWLGRSEFDLSYSQQINLTSIYSSIQIHCSIVAVFQKCFIWCWCFFEPEFSCHDLHLMQIMI